MQNEESKDEGINSPAWAPSRWFLHSLFATADEPEEVISNHFIPCENTGHGSDPLARDSSVREAEDGPSG